MESVAGLVMSDMDGAFLGDTIRYLEVPYFAYQVKDGMDSI